jgi:hypothetical protein
VRRDAFWVEEPRGPRWQDALQLLADGHYVVCMGLGLTLASEIPGRSMDPGSELKVRLETRHDPRRITAQQAAAEIENAEAGVAEICERSADFARIVAGRPVVYELLEDYGMGAVRLAFKDRSGFHFQGLD